MFLKRKHILVNGHKWEYLRFGKGEPIVLVHGFTANATFLEPVGKILAQKFDVIIPELPGCGWTKTLPDSSVPSLALNLEEFIKTLGIDSPILFAVSFGGTVCLEMALQKRIFIKKMFLQSPYWEYGVIHPNFDYNLETDLLKIPTSIVRFLQRRWLLILIFKIMNVFRSRSNEPSFSGRIWNKAATTLSRTDAAFAKKIFQTKEFFHQGRELSMIKIPTVLIGGGKDVAIPPVEVKKLKKLLTCDCQYVELEDASHAAIVEIPEKLAVIILENT